MFTISIDSTIRANYANFGFVPYGQTIIGKLHYSPEQPMVCDELDESMKLNRTDDISPFWLAKRGQCSFVQKVRNLENIGVSVAIIVDNNPEMIDEILMSDDGTGGGIRIPSMLIGQNDGKKLIEWFSQASEEELSQVVMMSDFVLPEFDRVRYDFWFTSSSDRGLSFLEDFEQLNNKLGDQVQFTPHYVFWECSNCDQVYLENDCYGNGKYCALEPSNANIRGQEIVEEDLRQLCMWENLASRNETKTWWDYIHEIHSKCYSIINEDCSRRAHSALGINWEETKRCVKESFTSSDWKAASTSNTKIDKEIAYWKQYGTNIYPSIVINQKTYRGQIEPLSVYNALCAGFSDPPEQCYKTLHLKKETVLDNIIPEDMDDVSVTAIIAAVIGLILVNVVIVYCCRRRAKREMANEMQIQIESAVSQYFALSQKDAAANQA